MNRIRLALAAAVASAALIAPGSASAATPPSVAAAVGSAAQGVAGSPSPETTAYMERMIKLLAQPSQSQLDVQRQLQDQMRQLLDMLQQLQHDRANAIARLKP
jgi:hypothetical protein